MIVQSHSVHNPTNKHDHFLLCRYLDGFSVFEVGSDGLIHCHRLHKVIPYHKPSSGHASLFGQDGRI